MRAVELFCGAGGMSRGLMNAGFDVVGAFDHWPPAVETYRQNLGSHVNAADLSDLLSVIPEIIKLKPDVVCGGPPCQDYSSAGRRQEGRNASMTVAFAIIVATVRPEWFLMENVVAASKSAAWAEAQAILENAGYGISESKVKCEFYGKAQARRRLFVCGRLGERHGFLSSAVAAAASAKAMTLRDLFEGNDQSVVYFHPRMPKKRGIYSLDETAPTIRASSSRPVPGSYAPHPADVALVENGFVYSRPVRAGRGVRTIDEAFPTVTRTSWERPGPKYLNDPHPADPAPAASAITLTRDQASRIQGFPTDWRWIASTQRDIFQMIANAVPPPVSERIGKVILARHCGETSPEIEGRFLDWLVMQGRSRASARNVKSCLVRARRHLRGRSFADLVSEIAVLEAVAEFDVLPKGTRSDLRQALRLYAEFRSAKMGTKRARERRVSLENVELEDAA